MMKQVSPDFLLVEVANALWRKTAAKEISAREADTALDLCPALAAVIPDWRRGPVRHRLVDLVRQRLYQIACGYADHNDATTLRSDPLLKLVCGRLPETEGDLARQPTFSRLENAIDWRTCYHLAVALVEVYLRERERNGTPTHILLDLDTKVRITVRPNAA